MCTWLQVQDKQAQKQEAWSEKETERGASMAVELKEALNARTSSNQF